MADRTDVEAVAREIVSALGLDPGDEANMLITQHSIRRFEREVRAEREGRDRALRFLLIGVCGTLGRAAEMGLTDAKQMRSVVRDVIHELDDHPDNGGDDEHTT